MMFFVLLHHTTKHTQKTLGTKKSLDKQTAFQTQERPSVDVVRCVHQRRQARNGLCRLRAWLESCRRASPRPKAGFRSLGCEMCWRLRFVRVLVFRSSRFSEQVFCGGHLEHHPASQETRRPESLATMANAGDRRSVTYQISPSHRGAPRTS